MLRQFLICCALSLVAGCSSVDYGAVEVAKASSLPPIQTNDSYLLGPGDKLQITVYREDELTGEQLVGPDGTIALPLAGRVQAAGHTVQDLSQAITTKLADGLIRNPSVAVSIINYRPFYILGEVTTPGQYEYVKGMSVLAAVARAGGFTYRARRNEIFLRREGSPTEVRVVLDRDTPIQPGDTIRIGERYF